MSSVMAFWKIARSTCEKHPPVLDGILDFCDLAVGIAGQGGVAEVGIDFGAQSDANADGL